ncbi:hypothetical protein GWI33_016987 [Rhynchophorus ferrugineus]|uniref:Uncharacterized protein n=1 Tax=Rhynchophorus ferrugineus TaxID=354439 RepID=A0A834HWX5_RHYFE|nr:hypothetical protein GWI33_016987 [Rhynchophorus ferrugineus]
MAERIPILILLGPSDEYDAERENLQPHFLIKVFKPMDNMYGDINVNGINFGLKEPAPAGDREKILYWARSDTHFIKKNSAENRVGGGVEFSVNI